MQNELIKYLSGGKSMDMRPALAIIGEYANLGTKDKTALFAALFEVIEHGNGAVATRAAYAVEKIVKEHPHELAPYQNKVLELFTKGGQAHLVRAFLLKFLRRFSYTGDDYELLIATLFDALNSPSSIVKATTLEMLAQEAEKAPELKEKVMPLLWQALNYGTPASRARVRKVLAKYKLL